MKKINRHNYEEYFLDYIEGMLDSDFCIELENFLKHNSDLKEELEQMIEFKLSVNDNIEYKRKTKLKVPETDLTDSINEENIDAYLIGLYENDLNEEQKISLHNYLEKNPRHIKDQKIYKSVHLQANQNEVLNIKEKLYIKEHKKIYNNRILYFISSAAAIVLILLFFPFKRDTQNMPIANNQPIENVKVNTGKDVSDGLKEEIRKVVIQKNQIEQKKYFVSVNKPIDDNNEEKVNDIMHSSDKKINRMDKIAFLGIEVQPVEYSLRKAKPVIHETIEDEQAIEIKRTDNKRSLKAPFDFNKDQKVKYWEIIKVASNTLNKLAGDTIVEIEFSNQGKLTELALIDDIVKIKKTYKN